ncbi:DNA gyrase subunit A [Candidatus Pacearchaeota archaeon]|nr:DNA gyrase subunit A [Candidatus Pacearchaeota archaeon]
MSKKKKDENEDVDGEEEIDEDDGEFEETDETQVEEDSEEVQVTESFVKTELSNEKGVINSEVSGEMKKAYLDYAMSVIVSRAIPAIEDGMKPVQRRILYSMQQMGLKSNTQTKKSARIVGDVIGKYHPHGDVAVYDAMVRMAQDFSLRYPLVYGQGNFGSLDGDPPAAYRYTEAKMEKLAEELLEDIDKETVEFSPNFDNSLKEPVLLPGKLPALILNGATGIAVGMATNIPPHNLREVTDAIVSYIENPNITLKELLQIVTGPDFPTGGLIQGDMNELYETGRGKLTVRGKIETEEKKGREILVVTEIPYMVNKSTLIAQIADLVRDKKIKDISDLRDESNKGKIRVVIELRKGVNSKFVINGLYKYTRLQDSFNVNFLALEKGKPKVLGLVDVLRNYVEYRKDIVTKRTKFDLKRAESRQEIVQGLIKALENIDKVIRTIRFGKDPSKELKEKFKFTENQVRAILETRLRQLTALEEGKLKNEEKDLEKKIKEYQKILGDIKEVLKIIKKEVIELKEKYGDPRRTQIFKRNFNEISEKDLVQEKEVVVSITDKGYVKRMDIETYKEQRRGGKGVIGSSLTTGDFTKQILTCSTHDYLMFFTTRGRVLWLKAYDVPEAERYGKGKAIINLLGLKEENATKVISVKKFEDSLMMATRKGVVKKITLSYFSNPRVSGLKAINLPVDNSDDLIGVEVVKEGQEISLATKLGKAIRFNSKDVRSMGRSSYGVTGIKLSDKDEVVSMEVLETEAIFTITKKGYGKRTAVEDYRKTARAGKGVINLKVNEKTGEVVNAISVNDKDSIIITTAKGQVIRMSLKQIRVMGRAAQGVRVVKLHQDDYVTDVVKVHDEESV